VPPPIAPLNWGAERLRRNVPAGASFEAHSARPKTTASSGALQLWRAQRVDLSRAAHVSCSRGRISANRVRERRSQHASPKPPNAPTPLTEASENARAWMRAPARVSLPGALPLTSVDVIREV
jgi:hypothetical protein